METENKIKLKIERYDSEVKELLILKEHCAANQWWPIVSELKKLIAVKAQLMTQLGAILAD